MRSEWLLLRAVSHGCPPSPAIPGDSAPDGPVAEKSLQLLAETLSVLRMVRGSGGSFSLAPNGFIWYCSLPEGLSHV